MEVAREGAAPLARDSQGLGKGAGQPLTEPGTLLLQCAGLHSDDGHSRLAAQRAGPAARLRRSAQRGGRRLCGGARWRGLQPDWLCPS